jgi:hypothetical protein
MNENSENTHWLCPNCNQIVEIGFDLCWNCQYEKTGNEKMLRNEQISNELIEEESIVEKDIPRSPVILNILGVIAILSYFMFIFSIHAGNFLEVIITVVILTLSLLGLLAIIWMKKWGLYLYTSIYLLACILIIEEENYFVLIYQIIPTIIVFWGFNNFKKMK